jgi:ribosomal protein S18 acetylase RimI-like enzyme
MRCATLSEAQRLAAANLASEAMSTLYDLVGDEVVPMLAKEFEVEGTELADAVALVDSTVEGLVASYPAEEYQSRQRVSLHHALGNLGHEAGDRLMEQLRQLAGQIPQGGVEGEYVARFAVRSDLRGSGAADRLMDLFVANHSVVTLHVRDDNARAIGFYRRHGFVRKKAGAFQLMQRG